MSGGANHIAQAQWDQWDRERVERARADIAATAWQKPRVDAEHYGELIATLEDKLYLTTVLLESALKLLDRRAVEHARTLELVDAIVRCDEILAQPRHLELAA